MLPLELSELDYQFTVCTIHGKQRRENEAIPRMRDFAYVLGYNARLTAEIEMIG